MTLTIRNAVLATVLAFSAFLAPVANASTILSGDLLNYGVLFNGGGGTQLSITNVTINGNVGVGGSGSVAFSGPGIIGSEREFDGRPISCGLPEGHEFGPSGSDALSL